MSHGVSLGLLVKRDGGKLLSFLASESLEVIVFLVTDSTMDSALAGIALCTKFTPEYVLAGIALRTKLTWS